MIIWRGNNSLNYKKMLPFLIITMKCDTIFLSEVNDMSDYKKDLETAQRIAHEVNVIG